MKVIAGATTQDAFARAATCQTNDCKKHQSVPLLHTIPRHYRTDFAGTLRGWWYQIWPEAQLFHQLLEDDSLLKRLNV